MVEMIKRIAAAIVTAQEAGITRPEDIARAVLEEMREPTGKMLTDGEQWQVGQLTHRRSDADRTMLTWRRMIEAALSD